VLLEQVIHNRGRRSRLLGQTMVMVVMMLDVV
jgi:hypothetical protein